MSRSDDRKVADSALASEPLDQAMDLSMCKIGDVTHLTLVGDNSAFRSSFGTQDADFLYGLLHQLANAGSKGPLPDERGIKFMLAFVKESEPRDEIEAAILAQMAATHVAVMRYHNRLAHAESLHEQDHAERTLNKLMRTFAALAEALQRYRAIRDRKVTVQNQNVSVSDGGPAIVGNVTRPALEPTLNKRGRLAPARSDARQAPMEITGKAQRAPVRRRRQIR
jgi:hypothetical protein